MPASIGFILADCNIDCIFGESSNLCDLLYGTAFFPHLYYDFSRFIYDLWYAFLVVCAFFTFHTPIIPFFGEIVNSDIVRMICAELGVLEERISYVADRKGHDRCYALDCSKMKQDFDWQPTMDF